MNGCIDTTGSYVEIFICYTANRIKAPFLLHSLPLSPEIRNAQTREL